MLDLLIGKALDYAGKVMSYFRHKKEQEKLLLQGELERQIVDDLRRSSKAMKGNCLTAEVGSERERLLSKIAAKGHLVRTRTGFMLPEAFAFQGHRFESRFP